MTLPTRLVALAPDNPDRAALADAAAVLRRGGLVAFPTETVYGLGGRALSDEALARIFAAKGRPATHPLIAHVLGEDDARELTAAWPAEASALVHAFWPGPLTLVLPRAARVTPALTGGSPHVAVRAPSHPIARGLIAALGEPIAAPSANPYQGLSPTRAEHVLGGLDGRVDLILDGGLCEAGIESTVLDLTGPVPRVLRPGALSVERLRGVVPSVVTDVVRAEEGKGRASPGMDDKHYAPRAKVVLVAGASAARDAAAALAGDGARVAFLPRSEVGAAVVLAVRGVVVRLMIDDPVAYARHLFATLHELDGAGVSVVVVEAVPDDEAWWGVRDRLTRAAFG